MDPKIRKARASRGMDDSQKRATVEKYIELRKSMTVREARAGIGGMAVDTVYKWANKFGLEDAVRLGRESREESKEERVPRKYKRKPTLISIPHDTFEPAPTQKTPGNIVVIMGDPDSVKSALQTAFNVVTQR